MSEAKYGDDRRHYCFPVFRFARTGYLATGPAPTLKLNVNKTLV
nr:hypothetical protein [Coxiella burnetii]